MTLQWVTVHILLACGGWLTQLAAGFLGGNRSKAKKEMGEKDGKAWHSDHSDSCLISGMVAFASEGPSFPNLSKIWIRLEIRSTGLGS